MQHADCKNYPGIKKELQKMETKTFDEQRLLNVFRQLDQRGKNTVIDFVYLQERICKQYDTNGKPTDQLLQFSALQQNK